MQASIHSKYYNLNQINNSNNHSNISCYESLRHKWSNENKENEDIDENINFASLEFHLRQKIFDKRKNKNIEKIKKETSNKGKPDIDVISEILANNVESFEKRQENNIQRKKYFESLQKCPSMECNFKP